MTRRLAAIAIIYVVTSFAWLVLGGTIATRTHSADSNLRGKVERLWGVPQVQAPPVVAYAERYTRTEESTVDGKAVAKTVERTRQHAVPLSSSALAVRLDLEPRQKGLLWYATYRVQFAGEYAFHNPTATARELSVAFPFPAQNALYDDFRFEIVGRPWVEPSTAAEGVVRGRVVLEPGEAARLRVGYRSQGLDRWGYAFGKGVSEVRDFRLSVDTDFDAVDFPDDGISPTRKARTESGWHLEWSFDNLVAGVNVGVLMPQKLQPGPLAGEIARFAPVSLAFFFVVIAVAAIMRGIDMHPMHFAFLAAAFFAFHLLLAYLADLVSIHSAFAIASAVSVALVVTYLRLVFGNRFAFVEAGLAQFVYLVLFSYAFFFRGLTGLAITIGAVVTLAVLMQVTARVDWTSVFARRATQA